MFEALLPTTKNTRYQYHQLLADLREANGIDAARLQCVKLGDYLYVRSDLPFTGSRERKLKTAGEIEFFFEYSLESVVSVSDGGRRYRVKKEGQARSNINSALAAGGLVDVEYSVSDISWEPFKNNLSHNVPVVRVSGRATVESAEQLHQLMLTGIGKRRSFGLGMLVLNGEAYAD